MARSLRFYGNWISFLGHLWPIILLVPIFGLTQGPSWWCMHLSAKMDSSMRISQRLVGHIMAWHLLLPCGPTRILLVSFTRQHCVPYPDLLLWDSSCKWLLSCLAKVGSFGQQFPNRIAPMKLCHHHQPYLQDPEFSKLYLSPLIS